MKDSRFIGRFTREIGIIDSNNSLSWVKFVKLEKHEIMFDLPLLLKLLKVLDTQNSFFKTL